MYSPQLGNKLFLEGNLCGLSFCVQNVYKATNSSLTAASFLFFEITGFLVCFIEYYTYNNLRIKILMLQLNSVVNDNHFLCMYIQLERNMRLNNFFGMACKFYVIYI